MSVPTAKPTALLLHVGGLICAAPLAHLVEVLRPLPVVGVSSAPASVLGVAAYRGGSAPVIRLSLVLGLGDDAPIGRFVALRSLRGMVLLAVERILGFADLEAPAPGGVSPLGVSPLLWDTDVVTELGARDGSLVAVLNTFRLLDAPGDAGWAP